MLSQDISDAVKDLHKRSEASGRMKIPLILRRPKVYQKLLLSFEQIYETFEVSLKNEVESNKSDALHDGLKYVYVPEYFRHEKIRADINFFWPDKKSLPPLCDEALAYKKWMETLLSEKPHTIISFIQVLYLALFGGGRIFRTTLTKHFRLGPHSLRLDPSFHVFDRLYPDPNDLQEGQELPSEEDREKMGLELFYWGKIPNNQLTRTQYENQIREDIRNRVNEAGKYLTDSQYRDVIETARAIFGWNEKLLNAIGLNENIPYHLFLQDVITFPLFWRAIVLLIIFYIAFKHYY